MGFQTLIMACQMSYYTSCHLCYVLYQSRISFGSWVCQNHVQTYKYIEIFNQKKLYFWQENTCMQSILYYTCFGGNPLKMPAKWQVYIKEETKLFLESMYLWGVPNILRKTLCMIFCLEMFTYMFNWIAAIMQSLWNLWWHGKLKKSPTLS